MKLRLRQIIDRPSQRQIIYLQDKSGCFTITKFNNCFIV